MGSCVYMLGCVPLGGTELVLMACCLPLWKWFVQSQHLNARNLCLFLA